MISFFKEKYEDFILLFLFVWISICSFINLGIISGIVFVILVFLTSIYSIRTSFCALLGLLYFSFQSLNIPNGYLITSIIIIIANFKIFFEKPNKLIVNNILIIFSIYIFIRLITFLIIKDETLFFSYFFTDITVFINIFLASFLLKTRQDVEFSAKWLGYIGVLSSILGYLYFNFNETAYINQLLANSDIAKKAIMGDSYLNQTWLRWIPAGKDPNFWGISLLLPLGYWAHKVSKSANIINVSCLIINLLGIFGSYSRSSLLVACFIILFTILRSKPKYLILSIFIIYIFIITLFYIFPSFSDRIYSIEENIRETGGTNRFLLWGEAINNFINYPILGIGTGQTRLYSILGLETHNLYLQVLCETGIFGFIIFTLFWFRPLNEMRHFLNGSNFYYYSFLGYSINLLTISNTDLRLPIYLIIMFYVYKNNYLKAKGIKLL